MQKVTFSIYLYTMAYLQWENKLLMETLPFSKLGKSQHINIITLETISPRRIHIFESLTNSEWSLKLLMIVYWKLWFIVYVAYFESTPEVSALFWDHKRLKKRPITKGIFSLIDIDLYTLSGVLSKSNKFIRRLTVWDNFLISAANFGTFFIVIVAREEQKFLRKNSACGERVSAYFYPGFVALWLGKIALRLKEPDE